MSTRYIKNRLSFLSSLASDYSRPREKDEWEKTYTTLTQSPYEPVSCATTGTTITTSGFGTSLSFLGIYNEDGTNYVRVQYYTLRGSNLYAASDINFNDVNPDTITRDAGTTFTASTLDFVVGGYCWVTGATVSANNSTAFLIQNVAASTLTLGTTMAVSGGDDAGTPTLYSLERCNVKVAPGEFHYAGPVFSLANLTITANTAACVCRVFFGAA